MSNEGTDGTRPQASSVDTRQIALVVLAVVAVVTAAFLLPTVAAPEEDPGDSEGSAEEAEPASGFGWLEWLLWLLPSVLEPAEHRCTITFESEPQPGEEVTIQVAYDGEPLADAPVWFDGQRVGTTDEHGKVTGEVPYVQRLDIRVEVPGAPDCRTGFEAPAADAAGWSVAADVIERSAAADVVERSAAADVIERSAAADVIERSAAATGWSNSGVAAAQSDEAANTTVSYDIDAEMTLEVLGEPYPGDTVEVRVRLGGAPLSDAAVTVNDDRIGTTDAEGIAEFVVPDDGTAELNVVAERGEFAATTTIDVLLLEAVLEPTGLAVVPGADAEIGGNIVGEPVANAAVTVDGDPVGTTGVDGRTEATLPADPTASVTVEALDQTATTSVAEHYRMPAVLFTLVFLGAVGVAYWRRGPGGVIGVVAVVIASASVVLVDAFYGARGRNAAVVALLALVALAVLVRHRRRIAPGAARTTGLFSRLLAGLRAAIAGLATAPTAARRLLGRLRERLFDMALRAVEALEGAVGGLGGTLSAWLQSLRSLPRSVSGLLRRLLASGRRGLRWVVDRLRSRAGIVAFAAVGATLTVGYLFDERAALTFAGVLVLAWVGLWRYRRDDGEPSERDTDAETALESAIERISGRSMRELWRAFARIIAPDSWRTKTPNEIARTAVDRGYPRGAVEELTRLFREVEYGGRSASAALRERAADAYAALRDHDRGDSR